MKLVTNVSKRDKAVLLFVIALAVGFIYYTYVLEPSLTKISDKKAKIEEMQMQINNDRIYAAKLPSVQLEREQTIEEIELVAGKYLPDLTTQYYYDLLNQKAHENGVSPTEIKTQLITPAELMAEKATERKQSDLYDAIQSYNDALNKNQQDDTSAASGAEQTGGRYEFKYIPVNYSITDGTFTDVQNFIKSLNDLEYTMYFKSAELKTNDRMTIDASFEIYFISIERVFDVEENNYIYETIPPAKNNDVFFYHFKKEDAIEEGIPFMTPEEVEPI